MKSKLWGGRFNKGTNKLVEEFTNSIHFDQKLAKYDVIGSLAHIEVLKKRNCSNPLNIRRSKKSLKLHLRTIESGSFKIDLSFEDIHSYIQQLVEKSGAKLALNSTPAVHAMIKSLSMLKLTRSTICSSRKRLVDDLTIALEISSPKSRCDFTGLYPFATRDPSQSFTICGPYIEMFNRDHVRLYNAAKISA